MKILFITKRRPQQRDLLDRPYGRFHYLPVELARRGHDVSVLLCSHKGVPEEKRTFDGVEWISFDVRSSGPYGLIRSLEGAARDFAPNWIVGCSDAWYGPLAKRLARRLGARFAIDAYDNYEAYMPWNLPLHWAWRRAVRDADCITATGPQLAQLLDLHRKNQTPTTIVPMAADPMFVPHERLDARAALGLPTDASLIGYTGGWAANRGTDVLLAAFRFVRERISNAQLVLTGRPPAHALAEPGVISLGYLPDAQLPVALSTLDVACVITADTSFGRYSYPAKLCEAMACQVPVVATATAPVEWMLANDPRFIVAIGDAAAIADRLLERLHASGRICYPNLPDWKDSARIFETALVSAQRGSGVNV